MLYKTESMFCLKVNCLASEFLSLQISHRSKCFFILTKFATVSFFKQTESPSASKVVSRKRLISAASVISLFWWISELSRKRWILLKTLIFSVSSFALYISTKMGSVSSIATLSFKIRPASSFLLFLTTKDCKPNYAIKAPQELNVPCGKKT